MFLEFTTFIVLLTCLAQGGEPVIQRTGPENVYCIHTISQAGPPKATWIDFNRQGDFEAGPENGEEVLEHFARKPETLRKRGIFVYSKTHSVPFTEKEKRQMTSYLQKLHQNPQWRESENALVQELVTACQEKEIPVWINISSDIHGEWKLLSASTFNEKDLARIRTVDAITIQTVDGAADQVRIDARGTAATGGWSHATLKRRDSREAGIYVFEFLAVPPRGIATQVLTSVTASTTFAKPPDIREVRVIGSINSKSASLK
jgi:hypothetical protein